MFAGCATLSAQSSWILGVCSEGSLAKLYTADLKRLSPAQSSVPCFTALFRQTLQPAPDRVVSPTSRTIRRGKHADGGLNTTILGRIEAIEQALTNGTALDETSIAQKVADSSRRLG